MHSAYIHVYFPFGNERQNVNSGTLTVADKRKYKKQLSRRRMKLSHPYGSVGHEMENNRATGEPTGCKTFRVLPNDIRLVLVNQNAQLNTASAGCLRRQRLPDTAQEEKRKFEHLSSLQQARSAVMKRHLKRYHPDSSIRVLERIRTDQKKHRRLARIRRSRSCCQQTID